MFTRPFYFLLHGETEANAGGIISGSLDVELTALGREQAQAAARALAGEPITAIYSSPLRRARETAEPVAQALRLPVRIVPEFIERSQGELEGKPRDTRIEGTAANGSESFEDFTQRVLRGLAQVDGRAPLVVAHLGVFRVLCHTLRIVHTEGSVANALPLRFVPLAAGGWILEAVPVAP
jgi:broad specificity phosphatase PhoE